MDFLAEKLCEKNPKQTTQHSLLHLIFREYGSKTNSRRDYRILRSLITGESYKLKNLWFMTSPQRISCDGTLAFFNNYQTCFDCSSNLETPHIKYCLPKRSRHERLEDAIIFDNYPESFSLPIKGHKAALFAVTKNNFLLRRDVDSGDVLQQVKLGKPPVRFHKINWNTVDDTFVVTSKQIPPLPVQIQRSNQGQETMEVEQFVIMSCMPLKFIAKFSLSKVIFGKNVAEATVFLDILMVMYSSSHVRMYNLPALLEMYRVHNRGLYDMLPDGSIYGSEESPLTHNMVITECPPCILEVRCRARDVMVTLPPCHYIMWPWSESRGYCCFSVQTGQMVDNGCLDAEDDSLEEKVALHADDSCRIIHMKNTELKVYKLVPQPELENRKMVEDFTIDLSGPVKSQTEPPPSVSLSGRILKKRVIQDCQVIAERTVLSMLYSEDLDMILLLSFVGETSPNDDKQLTVVGFYDNWNGQLYRQFELTDAPTEEVSERYFTYKEDTVAHIFKTLRGRMECHRCRASSQAELGFLWINRLLNDQHTVPLMPLRGRSYDLRCW